MYISFDTLDNGFDCGQTDTCKNINFANFVCVR